MGRGAIQREVGYTRNSASTRKETGLDREEFIKSVRQALGKGERTPYPNHPLLQETPSEIEERANAVRSRIAAKQGELVQKLGETAQAQGWHVCRASKPQEAADHICELAASSGAKLVVRADQQVLESVSVDSALIRDGVEVTVMARATGLSGDELRRQAARADIGLTGADYAIAETGSVVVLPRRGLSRLVSLLPPIHVAVVRPQEVVESLEDVFVLRRLAYYREGHDMSSSMNFITGPSRTADIEQTLVIGVHGPKQAHLVLLE